MLQFSYPVLRELYNCDFFIDNDILEEILALGNKVSPALTDILKDLLQNPASHTQNREWYDAFYVSHAFYLLLDLRDRKALPTILEMSKLPFADLDFLFGDALHEDFAEAIIKLGKDELHQILDFFQSRATTLSQKEILLKGIAQYALFYPQHRKTVLGAFEQHLQSFIQGKSSVFEDDELAAPNYLALLFVQLLDINATELEKTMLKCYDLALVDEDELSAEDLIFDEVKMRFPENIFERYTDLKTSPLAETSPYSPEAEEKQRKQAKYTKDEDEEKIWTTLVRTDLTQEPIKKKRAFRE